ncbi:MAG: hypothetical protein CSA86_05335 [Arcobacter sp.]|nr:MAG: hypothetical protein CSA86_05335 [Arcobacter sp.]
MKNYLFLTKDGFTFDKGDNETNNMQVLGTGMGDNIIEAFKDFKYNQSNILNLSFDDILAVEYVGDFIINLEL